MVVVVNGASRRSERALGALQSSLHAHGLAVDGLHVGTDEREVRGHVKRAVRSGADAVVVGGGDGTMAHAVDVLAHRKTTLGLIPLGTGNSFARSLGIPLDDVDAAVAVIARGRRRKVDLGRVNGTYFANFATIGLSSQIARATATTAKGWLGNFAYALSAIGPIVKHGAFRARIGWADGKLALRTQDIIVANGRYFGATPLAPDASLTDGLLTLFAVADPSRIGALKTYLALGSDQQARLANAHLIAAPAFRIRARAAQMISIDGSLLEKTPARFRVAPAALRVFV